MNIQPDQADVSGFDAYLERYKKGITIEAQAIKSLELREFKSYRERHKDEKHAEA